MTLIHLTSRFDSIFSALTKLVIGLIILFGSLQSWSQDDILPIKVTQINSFTDWSQNSIQTAKINLQLPDGFHAYKDQFRVQNIQPVSFKGGQITIDPEITFFDKFSKKTRKGFKDQGVVNVVFEAPEGLSGKVEKISFDLRYQICSEKVCYLPQTMTIEWPFHENNSKTKDSTDSSKNGLTDQFLKSLESNLPLAFALVFLAGILTSFTPCIFPMLPITISILGYHADKGSRWNNFSRSLAYVFGIAITYSILGVIAALTGNLFGAAMTNKWVLGGLCLLFVLMALSMWDFFELQIPAFIRNKLGTAKGHGLTGAFIMGLVAGIVASPCVGPVLVSILSFVSTTKNAVLGFTLLFTFAVGLGLIFIVIGLFSRAINLLPKSGAWMNAIKFLLGAGMWGAALYYAQFLLNERWWISVVALSFLAFASWKGAFHFRKKNYLRQSFLLAVFAFSATVLLLNVFKPEYLTPAFTNNHEQGPTRIEWIPYSEEVLKQAVLDNKPVLLDFYADWCAACHELEEKTYSHPEFQALSKQFLLVKFDATEETATQKKVLAQFNVKGLPTVIFINKKGDVLKELTFTQFLTWDELKPKMQEFLK